MSKGPLDAMARVTELLGWWDEGILNWISLFGALDEVLEPENIDAVIARLSPEVRDEFVVYLQQLYRDSLDEEALLPVAEAKDRAPIPESEMLRAQAIRAWLNQYKAAPTR